MTVVKYCNWPSLVGPQSLWNRSFGGVFCVVTLVFGVFCGCRGFCHRTESDLCLFLSLYQTWKSNTHRGIITLSHILQIEFIWIFGLYRDRSMCLLTYILHHICWGRHVHRFHRPEPRNDRGTVSPEAVLCRMPDIAGRISELQSRRVKRLRMAWPVCTEGTHYFGFYSGRVIVKRRVRVWGQFSTRYNQE